MFQRLSIQAKILLSVCGLFAIALAILMAFVLRVSTQYFLQSQTELLRKDNSFYQSQFMGIYEEVKNDVVLSATSLTTKNFLEQAPSFADDKTRIETGYANRALTKKFYKEQTIIDSNGQEVVRVMFDGITSSILTATDLRQVAQEQYFVEAFNRSKGQIYVTGIEQTAEGEHIIRVASPVIGSNDEKRGVLVFTVSAATFLDFLQEKKTPDSTLSLMQSDGSFLYHSDNSSVHQNYKKEESELIFTQVLSGKTGDIITDSHIISYVPILFEGQDQDKYLVLATQVPRRTALALMDNIRNILIVGAIVTIALLIIVTAFAIRTVTYPIKEFVKLTQKVAQGDIHQTIAVRSKDEIGQLADTFNQMTNKLSQVYENLEQKVQEKTSQLASKMEETQAKNQELNKSQLAILNLVQDLDLEKKKLQETEKNLEQAQKIGSFGNFNYDTRTQRSEWSETAFTVHGLPFIPGTEPPNIEKYFLLVHPEDQQKVKDMYATITTQTAGIDVTYRLIWPDKTIHWLRTKAKLVANEKGEYVYLQGTYQDITKEKEIDRMKTEFISLASHQLRTPLTAIKWFTEMILAGDVGAVSDEIASQVKNIAESNDRMIELVNSLLNISRIESGRMIVEPVLTNLGDLVQQTLTELQPKIQAKKHTVIVSVHPSLPKISIDPKLIRQVYLNFLTNAIKYTPENGEISIFISTNERDIVSQVSDNGYGIPQSQQKRVFEKFYRGDNIISVETDGTGLGLYLVKAIVESSGGKVWFESHTADEGLNVKTGTTFWFSLPLAGTPAHKGEVSLDS